MIISATAMIIVFMVVFSELYQDNLSDKKRIIAEDFGYSLQNEFIIAGETKSGYSREFEIPTTLEGYEYEVYIVNNVLVINYTENVFALPIPEVTGDLKDGINRISHINNTICVNC